MPREGRAGPARVMFIYWGRRGLTQFTLELARTALAERDLAATVSVSRQNENFSAFAELGPALFPVDTFRTNIGALTQAWRIPLLRQRLARRLKQDGTEAVIDLMPHVWSSFVAPAIRAAGARYVVIIHDAHVHPGDTRTLSVKGLLDRAMPHADLVLTLSKGVADRLVATGRIPRAKLVTLFHPDLTYLRSQAPSSPTPPEPGAPFRLFFMGRIMQYKGLDVFLDAVDLLRADGLAVEVGVFGEGPLGNSAARLRAMGAEVVNRWLSAAEIAAILARCHTVVLAHIEASQSGIAAMALAAGLPVVATPVGGLNEQIVDGVTGVLALRTDAPALADAIKRLLLDPALYRAVCGNIARTSEQRSMARFVRECVEHALHAGRQPSP
jgi:glycosyltransferase involved in cell wall biosynthesis